LTEETGYQARSWRSLLAFFVSPGILDERMQLYLATDMEPGPPAREPGEEIENVIVTWEEALDLLHRGEIEDAKTIIGLLIGQQHRHDSPG
jgi:ADP-ribose pyrophosphatase